MLFLFFWFSFDRSQSNILCEVFPTGSAVHVCMHMCLSERERGRVRARGCLQMCYTCSLLVIVTFEASCVASAEGGKKNAASFSGLIRIAQEAIILLVLHAPAGNRFLTPLNYSL